MFDVKNKFLALVQGTQQKKEARPQKIPEKQTAEHQEAVQEEAWSRFWERYERFPGKMRAVLGYEIAAAGGSCGMSGMHGGANRKIWRLRICAAKGGRI